MWNEKIKQTSEYNKTEKTHRYRGQTTGLWGEGIWKDKIQLED